MRHVDLHGKDEKKINEATVACFTIFFSKTRQLSLRLVSASNQLLLFVQVQTANKHNITNKHKTDRLFGLNDNHPKPLDWYIGCFYEYGWDNFLTIFVLSKIVHLPFFRLDLHNAVEITNML